ncbi:MAG TPA: hypothetical protein VKQ32_12330 [Polyangia bacterium]|nr:hypothetical protein [Polyangia bacterium]
MKRLSRHIIGAALLAISGCSGNETDNANDMVGTATFELAAAPADANCLQIVISGSRSSTRLLDLMPGQATTFTLNGLPLGNVTFTESAFSAACAMVTSNSIATWQSDPTPATLQAGVAANVTVVLRRNGTAHVTSDFQDDTSGACMPGQQSCTVGGMTQCVDLTSNVNNCGACGNVCQPVPNAGPVCAASMCTFSCIPGFLNCNMAAFDGCETNVNLDPNNCGGCGISCSPGTPCQMGVCATPPRINVQPMQVVFPGLSTGMTSPPFAVQVTNLGGSPLQLQAEMLVGPNFSDFILVGGLPPVVMPSQTVSVSVAFQPHELGTLFATLVIQSNDVTQPNASVQLQGTGM